MNIENEVNKMTNDTNPEIKKYDLGRKINASEISSLNSAYNHVNAFLDNAKSVCNRLNSTLMTIAKVSIDDEDNTSSGGNSKTEITSAQINNNSQAQIFNELAQKISLCLDSLLNMSSIIEEDNKRFNIIVSNENVYNKNMALVQVYEKQRAKELEDVNARKLDKKRSMSR